MARKLTTPPSAAAHNNRIRLTALWCWAGKDGSEKIIDTHKAVRLMQ